MKELFKEIETFQRETFPDSNSYSKVCHLEQEVQELKEELDAFRKLDPKEVTDQEVFSRISEEYADCFLLLIGSAQSYGLDYEQVCKAITKKLEKNRLRKWGKPDENGVIQHIKD